MPCATPDTVRKRGRPSGTARRRREQSARRPQADEQRPSSRPRDAVEHNDRAGQEPSHQVGDHHPPGRCDEGPVGQDRVVERVARHLQERDEQEVHAPGQGEVARRSSRSFADRARSGKPGQDVAMQLGLRAKELERPHPDFLVATIGVHQSISRSVRRQVNAYGYFGSLVISNLPGSVTSTALLTSCSSPRAASPLRHLRMDSPCSTPSAGVRSIAGRVESRVSPTRRSRRGTAPLRGILAGSRGLRERMRRVDDLPGGVVEPEHAGLHLGDLGPAGLVHHAVEQVEGLDRPSCRASYTRSSIPCRPSAR